jgi:hypothetical protein
MRAPRDGDAIPVLAARRGPARRSPRSSQALAAAVRAGRLRGAVAVRAPAAGAATTARPLATAVARSATRSGSRSSDVRINRSRRMDMTSRIQVGGRRVAHQLRFHLKRFTVAER